MNSRAYQFLISTLLITLTTISAFSQVNPLENNLVAWYPFNGNADDESGNGNDGTVNGPVLTTDRFGNSNSAYYFDGSNDYIIANNSPSFSSSTVDKTTLCAWVKSSSFSLPGNQIIHLGGNYTVPAYELYVPFNQDKIAIKSYKWQFPWYYCYSTMSQNVDEWYFVAAVLDHSNSEIKLYVNGVLNNQINETPTLPINPRLEIGRNPWPESYHHGIIDDVRIFNCALDPTQIWQLYTMEGILLDMPDTLMACHEDSIQLDAGSGFNSYLWNTGDITQTISVAETGTYIVTVEDGFSNTATDSTYVNIINAHIAQNDTTICFGGNVEISVIDGYTNVIEGFYFEGTFNGNGYFLSESATTWTQASDICNSIGGHLVTITSEEENNFIESFSPVAPNGGVLIGFTDELQEGNFVWVTGESVDYTNWASGEPNNYLNEDYTEMNYGQWWDCKNVTLPYILEFENYSNISYLWSTGDTTSTINVSPTATTTYYVEVTDGINWCLDSVTVYVNDPIQLNLPDTLMACHEDSLLLDAGAGFENYLWSTGDTAQTLAVYETGTYLVTVEDSFGCTATDSSYVNIISAYIAQNDTTIIGGDSVELSISGEGIINGLVVWYPFDGNTEDKSGYGYHAVNHGATLTTDRFGNPDNAYYFNGVDNYIQSPFNDNLNNASVSFWFNYETPITDFPTFFYFGSEENISNWIYYCQLTNNTSGDVGLFNRIVTSTTNNYDIYYSTTPPLNTWHHVCCIFNRAENVSKVYFNNTLVGQISTDGDFQSFDIVNIGTGKPDNWLVTEWFNGVIDDIRIYNCALAENDIETLFSGDSKNYSYSWSTGDTTAEIAVTPAVTTTYYVEITDGINWCTDSVTISIEHQIQLDLKVFLEGPYFNNGMTPFLNAFNVIPFEQPYNPALPYYNNSSPQWLYSGSEQLSEIPTNMVDWVVVQLRDAPTAAEATSATILDSKAGILMNDGSIKEVDGVTPISLHGVPENNLYVVIYHRNHLAIMSNYALTESGGIYTYDFTNGVDKVFGGNNGHKELDDNVWGMVAGDGNGNGIIQNTDETNVWKTDLGAAGYLGGDFDLNSIVQNTDETNIWKVNLGKGGQIGDQTVNGYKSQVPK